jgi:hypothetical protein
MLHLAGRECQVHTQCSGRRHAPLHRVAESMVLMLPVLACLVSFRATGQVLTCIADCACVPACRKNSGGALWCHRG